MLNSYTYITGRPCLVQHQLVRSLEKCGCKNNPEFLIDANANASAILIRVMFFLDTTHALI